MIATHATHTTRIVLPGLVEPDGLEVTSVPVPSPGPKQLLVQVEATGISFAEQSMRRGRYYGQPAFPFTPGYDLVGRVLSAGDSADEGMIGRRVATMTKTGAWAGHAVVEVRDSILVPDQVPSDEAETVVVNGVTAWQMLHRAAKIEPGQTILLFGANGGVGGILIQLALHHGLRVIGAASPRHHEALREAGVTPVDYADPDLAATVRALAPGGVDAVFDNIGGSITRLSFDLLAPGGTVVTYAIVGEVSGTGNLVWPFVKAIGQAALWSVLQNGRRATFYDLWAGHRFRPARFRRHLEADLGRVFDLLAQGVITANIAARFPLTEAAAALRLAESHTLNGKVILLP
ncbi:zinc-binding dehydrogenase [Subtercola boreus]|uniref:NADPH:quinone reductase n=1 Tax=Subtercola boreus TaxID=120213 RepID=A0A3E0WBD9_9MICO|nr:zinc-binding dehydrogenase [Subtercola boreus]RFA21172.1 NADPH:quinone reductase [Subtercola boreus]RFA21555.1 NADPH:quinone reductase [Subtercola boreus]RFA27525.1 NADPH:quinone reductase [Subtercola boreus]